jgi:hypothetical protein
VEQHPGAGQEYARAFAVRCGSGRICQIEDCACKHANCEMTVRSQADLITRVAIVGRTT